MNVVLVLHLAYHSFQEFLRGLTPVRLNEKSYRNSLNRRQKECPTHTGNVFEIADAVTERDEDRVWLIIDGVTRLTSEHRTTIEQAAK